MVVPRSSFLAAGGMAPVAGAVVEDVALAQHIVAAGGRVAMLDGGPLLTTRMFDDLAGTWRGWGRSLALPGVEPAWRLAVDLVTVAATLALPLPRLLVRRGDALDVVLVAARLGTLVGTSRAYPERTIAYWCSPLADVPATLALALGALRRDHRWRGRHYPHAPRARTAVR
jgi:dolichol-phosphate mannosyltransferase